MSKLEIGQLYLFKSDDRVFVGHKLQGEIRYDCTLFPDEIDGTICELVSIDHLLRNAGAALEIYLPIFQTFVYCAASNLKPIPDDKI